MAKFITGALRQRLEGTGHTLKTRSDTETIVHLYEDEGLNCFSHLNGMFAIAIWDANERRLVLARDRLGQKPLVYRKEAGRLLFASELKSLLQVPGFPRVIDPTAVDEFLTYQYVPHPKTIFRGVQKLPPAHYAVFQDGDFHVKPYWQPALHLERPMSEHYAAEQLRDVLTSSVKLRMQSDVPLGAFLSGGVDSSLITALMQTQSSEPVKTFSIGFPIPEYDESAYARRVAQHLGTDHQDFVVTPDAVKILPQLVWHFDEPFGDSSAIPTWYLSQMTQRHVSVALTGDGGDELFAGYARYRAVQIAGFFDHFPPLKSVLANSLWQRIPAGARQKSRLRQFKRFSEALAASPLRRYTDWISIFNETRRGQLYTDQLLGELRCDPFEFLRQRWNTVSKRDPLTATSLTDLTTYLPCDLMTKVDLASMAHSLECRSPFLDHRLVELAAAMPAKFKYRRGRGKRILQKAFGDLLPAEIWRRKKMGFGVPLDHWFRKELKEVTRDTLLDQTARDRQLFRPEVVQELVDQHQRGEFDHAARLWALVMFELWAREWVDGKPAPPAPVA